MSKAPEQNIPMGPDEAAARAHEVSSHGSAYWLHQKRVWAAPELREAFLAGTRYAREHAVPASTAGAPPRSNADDCPACGSPRVVQQVPGVQGYTCGSRMNAPQGAGLEGATFTQSAACVMRRHAAPPAARADRLHELGVRVKTVLEQNAVRTIDDCHEVADFMKHASSTGVALMQTIGEWMKGEPQG